MLLLIGLSCAMETQKEASKKQADKKQAVQQNAVAFQVSKFLGMVDDWKPKATTSVDDESDKDWQPTADFFRERKEEPMYLIKP